MSIDQWLREAQSLLGTSGSRRLDAELLLAHCLRQSRSYLLAHGEEVLAPTVIAAAGALLQRRARGEPLAYVLGEREFWSLTLQVGPEVLVPRPETELLIERALSLLPAGPMSAADLGTGSGAIAIALAHERPQWRITATDISAAALATASRNAVRHSLRIEWLEGSWFEPLIGRRFRLLLSNPPYLAAADPALADPALQHEPRGALVSGPTGLESLAQLIAGAGTHLEAGGWLLLEHGADQGAAVAEMLVARGYAHVTCHQDLAGLDRVTEAQWSRSVI